MADIETILRRKESEPAKVKAEEKDAKSITIDCVDEKPGSGYIVTVCPKDKGDGPGKPHKMATGYREPYKHLFAGKAAKEETLNFIKSVL